MDVVTGATGFVGPHLVEALVREGRSVRCLVREASRARAVERLGAEVRPGSLLDEGFVRRALEGADRVFHLAGGGRVSASSAAGLAELRAANVDPLASMLGGARAAGVRRFVHFSSISAMGVQLGRTLTEDSPCTPATPHEVAKYESEVAANEAYAREGVPVVVLRPSQIYGPGDVRSEILKLVRLAARGLVPLFGGGKGRVPWVHVADVVAATLLAAEKPVAIGRTYIISDRESYLFADVVGTIAGALGRKRGGVFIPRAAAEVSIAAVEAGAKALGREPPFTRHRLASMCGERLLSIERARRELGFEPRTGLEEGMRATVTWYAQQGLVRRP